MGWRHLRRFTLQTKPMQTMFHAGPWPPSFPPADAAIARVRSVDWASIVTRLAVAAAFTALVAVRLAKMLAGYVAARRDAVTVAAPIACTLATLTVAELRTLARLQLGSAVRIGGRRIAQACKADLITALGV